MTPGQKLIALVFVTTFMFQAGLAMPKGGLANVAGRVRETAGGVLLMFVLGPVAALLVSRAFDLGRPAGAALVLLATTGVVPLAPRGAKRSGGDVPLAILLMLVLSLLAVVTAAPSTRLLLSYWGPLGIEPAKLILPLVLLQALPLALGLFLRSRTERGAWLEKVLHIVNTVAFVGVAIAIVLPRLGAMKELGLRGAAASLVLAALMAAMGWALGGPTRAGRRTLVALANMPNVALALALVASTNAPPALSVLVSGVFLVRLLFGMGVTLVLARRAPPAARRSAYASAP